MRNGGLDVFEFVTLRARVNRPWYWMITAGLAVAVALVKLPHISGGVAVTISALAVWICLAVWVGRLKDVGKSWTRIIVALAASVAIIGAAIALFPIVLFVAALALVPHYLNLEWIMNVVLGLATTPLLVFGIWVGLRPTAPGSETQ